MLRSLKLLTLIAGLTSVLPVFGKGATTANDFKGKFLLVRNSSNAANIKTDKCVKIDGSTLASLAKYKSCAPFRALNAPLLSVVARCLKTDGTVGYIFDKAAHCSGAYQDLVDGDDS